MDEAVAERVQRLNDAVTNRDTERLWMLTTAAIEAGFITHFKRSGPQAGKMRGRSKVRIVINKPRCASLAALNNDPTGETAERKRIRHVKRRADELRTQANRLTSIARDAHAINGRPLFHSIGRQTQAEEPRGRNIRHTDLAFKTSAAKLGYEYGGARDDAK